MKVQFKTAASVATLVMLLSGTVVSPAQAVDTLLTGWESLVDDFDPPPIDATPSGTGKWLKGNSAVMVTLSQSTIGATQGTNSFKIDMVGKGNGGGSGEGDTHFDRPARVFYSGTAGDPRFTAIKDAVDGDQGLFTIEYDVTYDIATLRTLPWLSPSTDPMFPNNGRFISVGIYGNANESGGFQDAAFNPAIINPFETQYDGLTTVTRHVSVGLQDFTFQPGSATTFYEFGFSYNGNWGTNPSASSTVSAAAYVDNLVLAEFDPVGPIDFNNNNMADLGDWQLFMAQMLVASPALGDLVGNFGAQGTNGAVDRHDFLEFERLYNLANPGLSLTSALASIPEPGTVALAGIALLGFGFTRVRRLRGLATLVAAGFAISTGTVHAQVGTVTPLESWESIGDWSVTTFFAAGANPTITTTTAKGVTAGARSLVMTQQEDVDFSWNAAATWDSADNQYDVLRNAANLGAEHFDVLMDVTFDPVDLPNVTDVLVYVGLGSFNAVEVANFTNPGSGPPQTVNVRLPLSNFGPLQDVEDEGVTSYTMAIGIDGLQALDPFKVYFDNVRLEQVTAPDLLTLEINRSNGAATLKNLTANPISWDYLEIKSEGASLDVAGWNSLDDQNIGGAGTWLEAGGSSASALVEASLLGSHMLAPSASMSLGNLYNEFVNAEDVDFEIRRVGGSAVRTYDQLVTYIGVAPPVGVPGDYNGNNVVDAADYVLWRNGGPLQNESASPGVVDAADYTFWRSRFGATSGSGLGGVAAVPEPATWMPMLAAVAGLLVWSRRGV